MTHVRTADPYVDTDVIDARAPRFNQGTVALVGAIALITGAWWLLGLLALQLIVGLAFGRRYCLPCLAYFELVQPRLGEGPVEDARPVRFANVVGATFLAAATAAFAAGAWAVGVVLGALVVALAALAAATGLCLGCEAYRVMARLRGVRPGAAARVDLDAFGVRGPAVIGFTHPLCSGCKELERRLRRDGRQLVSVDVARHPDLARRYHVTVVPYAVEVDERGRVLRRIA